MKVTYLILCLLMSGLTGEAMAVPPRPRRVVNTPAERRMDKNRDGIVQRKEVAVAKSRGVVQKPAAVNRPWEKVADRNHDGHVSRQELRVYTRTKLDANGDGVVVYSERMVYWERRWAVSSDAEKQYDLNGDGYLSWPEALAMLKAKHAQIMRTGQAPVETDLELEFDINSDGILDRVEAPALARAIAARE